MNSPNAKTFPMRYPVLLLLLSGILGCQDGTSSSSDEGKTANPSSETPAQQDPPEDAVVTNTSATAKTTATVSGSIKVVGWEHEFVPSAEYSEGDNFYFLDEPDFGITASYWGVEAANNEWIHAGASFPMMGMRWAPVANTTFEPRNAALRFDPKEGWRFQHDNLPPGTYCFIVGWKQNHYQCAWKMIEAGDDLKMDFEIDLNNVSEVEVLAPVDSEVWFRFQTPAEMAGDGATSNNYQLFEQTEWSVVNWRGPSITVDESGKFVLSGMAPGHYRFRCSESAEPIHVVIEAEQKTTIKFEE